MSNPYIDEQEEIIDRLNNVIKSLRQMILATGLPSHMLDAICKEAYEKEINDVGGA